MTPGVSSTLAILWSDVYGRGTWTPVLLLNVAEEVVREKLRTVTTVNIAKRRRFESAKVLNADFRDASGVRNCEQTVRKRFHAANIRACKPAVCPPFTPEHRRLRLHIP